LIDFVHIDEMMASFNVEDASHMSLLGLAPLFQLFIRGLFIGWKICIRNVATHDTQNVVGLVILDELPLFSAVNQLEWAVGLDEVGNITNHGGCHI
jgi:hypothetical protein